MSEGRSQLGVTRRELYSTTAQIYVFIGLVVFTVAQAADVWYRFYPALFIALIAIALGLLYSFLARRQKGKEVN